MIPIRDTIPHRRAPVVTWALIAVNFIVFFYELTLEPEDLERLFGLLATRAIRPRVAERISFDEVAEAHRRLEAGGLEGKLVFVDAGLLFTELVACPDSQPRNFL